MSDAAVISDNILAHVMIPPVHLSPVPAGAAPGGRAGVGGGAGVAAARHGGVQQRGHEQLRVAPAGQPPLRAPAHDVRPPVPHRGLQSRARCRLIGGYSDVEMAHRN